MRANRPRTTALLTCGFVLTAGGLTALAAKPEPLRNVVLLITDDQGLQLGCYGDKVIKTPAMDRLATEGTRFAAAFGTVSSCSPSRAVIMSGQYGHTNGQYGLAQDPHNFQSLHEVQGLPNLLKKAGYRTGYIGKYHVQPVESYAFDEHLAWSKGRDMVGMGQSVRSFITADPHRPFLLLVGLFDPHRAGKGFANDFPGAEHGKIEYKPEDMVVPPWLPDNPDSRGELAEYYQAISRADQGVDQVLTALESTGRRQDTLIVFVSDNGPPFPGAKTTLYDPGIHLPLIVAAPDQKRSGVVSQAMVSFVDIVPTILDWARTPIPKQTAGRSLVPILDQENPSGWDEIYGSHTFHEVTMYYPMRMVRTRKYKYILNLAYPLEVPSASDLWGSATWQGVLRRGDQQYGPRTVQAFLHRPKEELYDLEKDPLEAHNLAAQPELASVCRELRERVKQWQHKTRDPWIIKEQHE